MESNRPLYVIVIALVSVLVMVSCMEYHWKMTSISFDHLYKMKQLELQRQIYLSERD